MTPVDAIIVGSGVNGLTAAIRLVEAGRSVVVLEAAARLGGAIVTEELTLPGFRHDTFSSVYPAGAASPVFARMPLDRFGLHWVHPPVAVAHPFRNGRAAALFRDLNRTVNNLDRLTPGDGQRWRALVSPYVNHGAAVRAVFLSGFPPVAGGLRLSAALRLDGALQFARLLLLSVETLAHEWSLSGYVTALLYGTAMHADVPPWEAGSAIAGLNLLLLGHLAGWPSPKGGSGNLVTALVGYLTARGGVTRTETPVERIVVDNGRVRGVVTAAGETIAAPVVIADVTPHGLLFLAGHALPPVYRARMARYRYGPGTFKLDWALDGPIPWEAEEARMAGTVHVGGTVADLTAALREQHAGRLPNCPFLLAGQQSLADPTRAPAGKHTAWAYSHVPPNINWQEETERFAERMEMQIERFAPGFRDRILARHILTPPDLTARNANLVGGDVAAGSTALDQLIFRPIPSLSPYRTPIHGLYIGSAATFPGAGVNGVAGDAAARCALRDTRLRRFFAPLARRPSAP